MTIFSLTISMWHPTAGVYLDTMAVPSAPTTRLSRGCWADAALLLCFVGEEQDWFPGSNSWVLSIILQEFSGDFSGIGKPGKDTISFTPIQQFS